MERDYTAIVSLEGNFTIKCNDNNYSFIITFTLAHLRMNHEELLYRFSRRMGLSFLFEKIWSICVITIGRCYHHQSAKTHRHTS